MNLYSTDNPEQEVSDWISGLRYIPDSLTVCLGAGDGRHVTSLLSVLSPADKLVVVEPEDSVWESVALKFPTLVYRVRNWSEFRQVFLMIGDWNYVITAVIPAYEKEYGEFWSEFSRCLDKELNNLQSDQSTTIFFAPRWQENILRNVPYVAKAGTAFGAKVPEGTPGIIVGAGPSLDLDLVDKAKGRALIIATQTTNRVYQERDIKPDLIMTFDGGFNNYYEHFQNVSLDVPLVFDPVAYTKAVSTWKGPLCSMIVHHTNLWLEDALGIKLTECNVGPSISNTALDFAFRIGCDPIILVGQDLAFTSGRFHLKGTHKNELWDSGIPPEIEKRIVKGVNGNDVVSSTSMLAFLHWFEETIRGGLYKDTTLINCSKGAYINGMKHEDFPEMLDRYCCKPVDLLPFIEKITTPQTVKDSRLFFQDLRTDLMDLKNTLSQGIAHCRNVVKPDTDRKKLFGKMAEVDKKIVEKSKSLTPLHYIVRARIELLDRTAGENREKEFTKVVGDTKKRYDGLMKSIEFCLPFIDELT